MLYVQILLIDIILIHFDVCIKFIDFEKKLLKLNLKGIKKRFFCVIETRGEG